MVRFGRRDIAVYSLKRVALEITSVENEERGNWLRYRKTYRETNLEKRVLKKRRINCLRKSYLLTSINLSGRCHEETGALLQQWRARYPNEGEKCGKSGGEELCQPVVECGAGDIRFKAGHKIARMKSA